MNRGLAGLNFRSRIVVGPNLVADRDRTVAHRLRPVALPTGLERNRTINETEPRYTRRRVLSVLWPIVIRLIAVALHIGILIVIRIVRRSILCTSGTRGKSNGPGQKQERISDLIQ